MATAVQRQINKATGYSSKGSRARESNKVQKGMRNRARRKSNGGQGG